MTPEQTSTWLAHRRMIVLSQMAPTALLITTVALLQFGLADNAVALRVAAAGILLFQSASEAHALLRQAEPTKTSWMWVVQYVTPTIFVVIYVALMVALFA